MNDIITRSDYFLAIHIDTCGFNVSVDEEDFYNVLNYLNVYSGYEIEKTEDLIDGFLHSNYYLLKTDDNKIYIGSIVDEVRK